MARNSSGLQLEENLAFERREALVERVAWPVIAAVLVAAVAGVFGAGPVSRTTTENRDGTVSVTYQRFARQVADTQLQVRVAPGAVREGTVTVFISAGWIANVDLRQVIPSPDKATRTDDGVYYEFSGRPQAPVVVSFGYRPNGAGLQSATVHAGNTGGAELWQLIYP
ncbi:MAG TPA: hypothetical protein VGR21_05125 [Cryptosporangiaceae bacterium]|nr:hypothetical protein [Cryptosporangiaceae bacterium]